MNSFPARSLYLQWKLIRNEERVCICNKRLSATFPQICLCNGKHFFWQWNPVSVVRNWFFPEILIMFVCNKFGYYGSLGTRSPLATTVATDIQSFSIYPSPRLIKYWTSNSHHDNLICKQNAVAFASAILRELALKLRSKSPPKEPRAPKTLKYVRSRSK